MIGSPVSASAGYVVLCGANWDLSHKNRPHIVTLCPVYQLIYTELTPEPMTQHYMTNREGSVIEKEANGLYSESSIVYNSIEPTFYCMYRGGGGS